ncbi:HEAT repeat domain-containing protein [Hyalangium minutum]|uniref:HEAT repeat protein n=1 Tax=Hyalangium minutum TaxID=394096 RepID=A0A085W8P1_9BACT|nr:hypothetical protein [Hyalangium minutum]KFE64054.1 hypothetical protein DB31_2467 [Hyalangium minutum]
MSTKIDLARIQEELVQEFRWGNEARVRELVAQLGAGPRQIRTVLETMLGDSESLVRQAAAFGLGELGGPASASRLEQQLAVEEARGDHGSGAVVEDIVRALGRIKGTRARASLVRKLERLASSKPEIPDVNELARALWRQRHPDLIPILRRSLETRTLPEPNDLHGLLVLLEKSPEALDTWARDASIPIDNKTQVLVVLEEDVPASLLLLLPAFVATADSVSEQAQSQDGDTAYYCERLFSLLLGDRKRFIPALPEHARARLRVVAQRLVALPSMGSALPAAVVLGLVGRPEDIPLLEKRRPADDPVFAKVFDDAVAALRKLH